MQNAKSDKKLAEILKEKKEASDFQTWRIFKRSLKNELTPIVNRAVEKLYVQAVKTAKTDREAKEA